MLETFERGKKYEVLKEWSDGIEDHVVTRIRHSLSVGEVLRFRGPNFTGAEFLDDTGKLVCLPVKVAFRIMGNLTQHPPDLGQAQPIQSMKPLPQAGNANRSADVK